MSSPQTNLRRKKQKAGLKMCELAKLAGVNYYALSRHECGWLPLSTATAERLATALDCDPAELMEDDR